MKKIKILSLYLNYRLALQYTYKVRCWMKNLNDWCKNFYLAILTCWMNLKLGLTRPPVMHQMGDRERRRRRNDTKKTQVLTQCTYIEIHSDVLFYQWEWRIPRHWSTWLKAGNWYTKIHGNVLEGNKDGKWPVNVFWNSERCFILSSEAKKDQSTCT